MNRKQPYPALFEGFQAGALRLANRVVALPVYTGYARPDGTVSPLLIDHYTRLAQTGAAMVVVANVAVAADGILSRHNLRIDGEEFVPGLTQLADAIRSHGAVACLQLNHAGRFAKTDHPMLPSPIDRENLAFNIASLKHFMNFFPLEKRFPLTRYFLKMAGSWRFAMSAEDRRQIVASFGSAAKRAFRAGFDAVELHGAGGYLLCQFLSPFTHKGQDRDRLPFQDRIAFPLTVLREVRRNLPDDFPVGFRLMVNEWVPGGIDLTEAIDTSRAMERESAAYFSVAAGTYNSIFAPAAIQAMSVSAYLEKEVKALSAAILSPVIISGRITTPETANRLVTEAVAPLVGLGRPLRTDSQWLKKAAVRHRKITTCINCNWCIKRVVLQQGFSCKRWPKTRRMRTDLEHSLLTRNFRQLLVLARDQDLDLFKRSFKHFLPDKQQVSPEAPPTVLFLVDENREPSWAEQKKKMAGRYAKHLKKKSLGHIPLESRVKQTFESYSEVIKQFVAENGHGFVVIGQNRRDRWRERLLYELREKVIAVVGAANNPTRVLVPVDLSPVTALIMRFLRNTYLGKQGFDIQCVHVLEQPLRLAESKWVQCLRVAGLEQPPPIHYLAPDDTTGRLLVDFAEKEGFGTIMMGKRGLSRIKRWLLGSVSTGVLRNLTDQSFFLID